MYMFVYTCVFVCKRRAKNVFYRRIIRVTRRGPKIFFELYRISSKV